MSARLAMATSSGLGSGRGGWYEQVALAAALLAWQLHPATTDKPACCSQSMDGRNWLHV